MERTDQTFKAYLKRIMECQNNTIFKAMGFTDAEIKSTRIAVVNSWSEQSPGHIHLRTLSDSVKSGIRTQGAMPFELNVLGACNALSETVEDSAHYDLPQREVILSSIEVGIKSGKCDGWIGLCTCDKIVPAMLMAAVRINKPCMIVCGGSMLPGEYEGSWISIGGGQGLVSKKFLQGNLTDEEMEKITSACGACSGACAEMTTGNTMQLLAEALGMALPYSSTIPALFAEQKRMAFEAGRQVVSLARKNIKPSHIIHQKSLENAIRVANAIGGATNSVIHIQALAWEASVNLGLETWDEIGRKTPTICSVMPNGPFSVCDLHSAGGLPAVMKELGEELNLDCLTVTENTLRKNIEMAQNKNPEVIRPLSNPITTEGAIAILRGNLAPRGAIVRHTIIENKKLLKHTFEAVVFNTLAEALECIFKGSPKKVKEGNAVICRYVGPRGGPGMAETFFCVDALNANELRDVCFITDGRLSGCTRTQLAIGYVCPEAYIGGPLAAVEDGDLIEVNVPERRLEIKITELELKKRMEKWTPPESPLNRGILSIYSQLALQADQGAGWASRV